MSECPYCRGLVATFRNTSRFLDDANLWWYQIAGEHVTHGRLEAAKFASKMADMCGKDALHFKRRANNVRCNNPNCKTH